VENDRKVLAVSMDEAARLLGVSPRTVASLARANRLISRRIGRRRVIPVSALDAFLRRDHPAKGRAGRSELAPANA
jgi:excisionase family DNA binding protein